MRSLSLLPQYSLFAFVCLRLVVVGLAREHARAISFDSDLRVGVPEESDGAGTAPLRRCVFIVEVATGPRDRSQIVTVVAMRILVGSVRLSLSFDIFLVC